MAGAKRRPVGTRSEFVHLLGDLCNLSHGTNARLWQWTTFFVEMIDDVLNDFT